MFNLREHSLHMKYMLNIQMFFKFTEKFSK